MGTAWRSWVVLACSALVFSASVAVGDDSRAPSAPQVMLKLQVVEVSLAGLRTIRGEFKVFEPQDDDGERGLHLHEPQAVADELQTLLNAKVLKLLAEPNLVTVVGRPLLFESGGKSAVPTVQADKSVKDEYWFFGTKVDLLVTSLREGKVVLRIRPEISQRNDRGIAGATGRIVRSMDATLEMPLGKTAVIAGLTQQQSDREAIGTRLVSTVFLITPHLVEAAAPATASLPTPADSR